MMRQVLYTSESAGPMDRATLEAIVDRSRHNNALDGITGLLWVSSDRFVQVIEGDERAISEAMDRIRADIRHRNIVTIQDRTVREREFGSWTMQLREGGADDTDQYDAQLRDRLARAAPEVRAAFAGLMPPATA